MATDLLLGEACLLLGGACLLLGDAYLRLGGAVLRLGDAVLLLGVDPPPLDPRVEGTFGLEILLLTQR